MAEQTSEAVSGGDCDFHHIEPAAEPGTCNMVGWAVLRLSEPCLGATQRWVIQAGLYGNEKDALALIRATTGTELPMGWRAAYVRVTNNIQWTFEELPDPEQTVKRRRKLAEALALEPIKRLFESAKAMLELRECARRGYIAMGFGGENTYATEAKFDFLESAIRMVSDAEGEERPRFRYSHNGQIWPGLTADGRAFEGLPRMAFDVLRSRHASVGSVDIENQVHTASELPDVSTQGQLVQLDADYGEFHRFDVALWDGSKWVPYAIAKTTEYKCEHCGHQFRYFVASVLSENHVSLSCEQCGDHDVRQLPPSASSETRGSSVAAD